MNIETLRIMTVRDPWAWAIVHAGKDVENRGRNIAGSYRGPVAIHAGLALDEAGFEHPELRSRMWWKLRERLTPGAILGVVDIVGAREPAAPCRTDPIPRGARASDARRGDRSAGLGGDRMSSLEDSATIAGIVGAPRHPVEHLGRAVSAEERVYVLHSQECADSGIDLRQCPYSIALDEGIDLALWAEFQDVPVVLAISEEYDDLEPVRQVAP